MTLSYESGDYTAFLSDWYNTIDEAGGLPALQTQVGNYGILYQFLICLMTYLPLSPLSGYKLLSLAFDIILALACGIFAISVHGGDTFEPGHDRLVYTFIAVLFLPTVILNSSLWAQCDSIYTAFAIMALLCLCKERDAAAFLLLGIAFSFKLQTIFIVPVFLFIAFLRKRLHYALLSLVSWYASCMPGFIAGRSLLSPLEIYREQTGTYGDMFRNFPSAWVLVGADYSEMGDVAVLYTFVLLAALMLYLLNQYRSGSERFTPYRITEIACLMAWTCVEFLPSMHDRYSYMVEILLVILITMNRRYIVCLIPEGLMILMRYRAFLFAGIVEDTPSNVEAVVYLLAYIAFAVMVIGNCIVPEEE